MDIRVIGIDIAKRYFQIHAVSSTGAVSIRRKVSRDGFLKLLAGLPPCLVGMETGSGAHYWARQLAQLGHSVRLMPPQFVRPHVKTNKNDAADAEACCEAVQRPGMRFVPVKLSGSTDGNGLASGPRPSRSPANGDDQCLAGTFSRVWKLFRLRSGLASTS